MNFKVAAAGYRAGILYAGKMYYGLRQQNDMYTFVFMEYKCKVFLELGRGIMSYE